MAVHWLEQDLPEIYQQKEGRLIIESILLDKLLYTHTLADDDVITLVH